MQRLDDFSIKRSGATMTIIGTDEKGKPVTVSGFYSVYQMTMDNGSKAVVGLNKESDKSVILGPIIPAPN